MAFREANLKPLLTIRIAMISAVLLAASLAQYPGTFPGMKSRDGRYRVEDLEAACEIDGLAWDERCHLALRVAAGDQQMVETERLDGGGYVEHFKGSSNDPLKLSRLGDLACRHRHWDACVFLGMLLMDGKRIQADCARGRAVFKQACQGGHHAACTGIEPPCHEERRYVPPPPPSPERRSAPPPPPTPKPQRSDDPVLADPAAASLQQACDGGELEMCSALAQMILGGNVNGAMPERARAPLERACRGGQRESCALLKHLAK